MFTALAVAACLSAPVPKIKPAEYFPTAVGTKRVYQLESDPKRQHDDEVVAREEKDGTTRVTVRFGKTDGVYVVSADQVVRQAIHKTTGVDELVLKLPLKAGGGWTWDRQGRKGGLLTQGGTIMPGEPETVTTPAGGYTAVPLVTRTTTEMGVPAAEVSEHTVWWAAGVGPVRQVVGKDTWVLAEFTPGKKK